MDHYQNNGNGYSDLQQIELAIQAAQHMVGQATRSMDENQLKAANEALQQAHTQFKQALAYQNNIDEAFFRSLFSTVRFNESTARRSGKQSFLNRKSVMLSSRFFYTCRG